MKYTHCLLLFLLVSTVCGIQAQTRIFGKIIDSTSQILPRATTALYVVQDSSLFGYDLSDDAGLIELSGVRPGLYRLQISYLGFETWEQILTIEKGTREINLGDVQLKTRQNLLQTTEITANRIPITVRGDTLELSASLVKVQAHDAVEDMLKKMPGMELDQDGTLKAQGEDIKKIMVDGKEFFGTDIKMALKMLPADAVDKIQIIDKKSDKAEFSGIDDGQREKILNIKTKPDRQKANFGKSTLGVGPPQQFDLVGTLNKFSPKRRLTGTLSANNVNRNGNNDVSERGLTESNALPSGGINTNVNSGLNFFQELPRKWQIYGNYRLNLSDRNLDRIARVERYLATQTIINQDTSKNDNYSLNQNLNLTFESDRRDTMWGFRLVGGMSMRNGNNVYDFQSLASDLLTGPRNTSLRNNRGENETLGGNLEFTFRKRLGKKGRNLNLDLDWDTNDNQNFSTNQSRNFFFATATAAEREVLIHQERNTGNDTENWSAQISFSEPLSKRFSLHATYNYRSSVNNDKRLVSDVQDSGQLLINEQQSNHLLSDVFRNHTTLGIQADYKKLDFGGRVRWENTFLRGGLFLQEAAVNQQYDYLLPSFNLTYRPKQSKTLSLNLDQSLNLPSIRQLQPVQEVTDALRYYIGNPTLTPELRYNGSLRYNLFDSKKGTTFLFSINGTLTTDKIQTVQEIDEQLVTKSTPQNVSNDYSTSSNIYYVFPVKAWGIRFSVGSDHGFGRNLTFINRLQNTTYSRRHGGNLSVTNQKQKKWEWSISGRMNFTANTYSSNAELNRNFLQSTFGSYLRKPFAKEKYSIESQFNYIVYSGLGDGFQRSLPIWNASFSAYVLEGKKGQLRLSAYDLLGRNQGVSRNAQLNTLVDEQVNALSRYVMLSFSYLVRNGGKKK